MDAEDFYRDARRDLPGPLAGLRVVEATTTWAGPMCGCLLADYGADVIKVEHPDGEVARRLPPFLPGTDPPLSFMQTTLNRNKRSLCLDLHETDGRELFLRVAERCDVVIENFRPGALDAWGSATSTCALGDRTSCTSRSAATASTVRSTSASATTRSPRPRAATSR